ncbi:cilia- and flagella-associated protein 61 [Lampris incognitus]|uniref:cilia- and flagella-associated protein 61 n=1 Tax=Lampris incognitus TaxID=2546036 RepID=UPI0024B634ED|nr:cilia- and flagella-associated protein 61 [Lampris incognitus]
MRTMISDCGEEEAVTVRRTELSDAQQIDSLIDLSALAVFGKVNIIHILEKANLAVTLANEKNEVLAHASFCDYPIGDLVDQTDWEAFLHQHFSTEHFTPLNTLFLHLYVAQPSFSKAGIKEILRAVFNVVTELQYICLLSPNVTALEPALDEIFKPLKSRSQPAPQCLALVCHRHNYCPMLRVRSARKEDYEDIKRICAEQDKELSASHGPYNLAELIEAQSEGKNHVAVCESDGVAVGFISVCADVDLVLLNDCFELDVFGRLYKPQQADQSEIPPQDPLTADHSTRETQTSTTQDHTEEQERNQHPESTAPRKTPNAFCIQLLVIDKNYEMRSVDFLPFIFKRFPDRDFCIITVPNLKHDVPLLLNFLRVAPQPSSVLHQELYIFHRTGLLKSFEVRTASAADRAAVSTIVEKLSQHQFLLEDLDEFCQRQSELDGTPLKALVAQVQNQVVGVLIIKKEQDMDYICSHYNIENFIYFSHHGAEEHAQMCHFALNPIFQHYAKHFLQEALRQAHISCLYQHIDPPYSSQKNSCVHPLTSVLQCMVLVRPRRQISYPLKELGTNAPERRITQEQPPFALNFISRKLTMEPKLTINTRIVVVGASETGLSFLEVLAVCPHLRFLNLTLISTHGFPGDHNYDDVGFLSTSHAYSSRDFGQLGLRPSVSVVTGKMVGIDRKAKHILVSGGRKVPYDHAVLCMGQQYQVPCPTSVNLSRPVTNRELPADCHCHRYTGHVPSNLLTLNDQHDCCAARHWLAHNFVEQDDNAIVYGNSIDIFTCVDSLLGLGVLGPRIHVVLLPMEPGTSCFSNPSLEGAMERALQKAEVHIHCNCVLAQMNEGEHPEPLTSVSFTTDGPPLHLTCGVFINLSSRRVDYDAFRSINDACLVFDGRLVIDTTFHTNDSSICAAGPLTKFSRRYDAEQWTHHNFNSKEVGQELAAAMLPLFDPTLEPTVDLPPDADRLTPVYKQPKVQGGRLPGGYYYLHLAKPSVPEPAVGPSFVPHAICFGGQQNQIICKE